MQARTTSGDWQEATLDDVAHFINGFAFKPHHWQAQGLPIIRIAQMQDPNLECDRYPGAMPDQHRIDDGDLLFSWSATLLALVWDRGPAYVNQHIFKVVPKENFDLDFVHHLIDHNIDGLAGQSHGTTMKHVKRSDLLPFPVRVPPLPEQRRIAEILDTLDEAIRKTEQVIAKLQQMKQGLLHDLLTRGIDENGELRDPERHPEQFQDSSLGRIPKGWTTEQLGDHLAVLSGFAFPSNAFSEEQGLPLIRIRDIGNVTTEIRFRGRYDPRFVISKGDLLVGMDGDFLARRWQGEQALLNQRVCRIEACAGGSLSQHWLSYMLQPILDAIHRRTPQTTVRHLSTADICSAETALPPIDEQEKMAAALESIDARVAQEARLLDKLGRSKHGLMDDLLTGRVRVRVPEEATT